MPLLLLKGSLKKTLTVNGLNNDKAAVFGKQTDLLQSSSCHYCIDLHPSKVSSSFQEKLHLEKRLSNDQCKAQMIERYKKFVSAKIGNINKLIKSAGLFDKEIGRIIDVEPKCKNCCQFKKSFPDK